MKSGPFIKLVSASYKVEEKTVTMYARLLKNAGLFSMGARGINAPDMTPLDSARITIALLATDRPARCVERVRRFGALRYQPTRSQGPHPAALGICEGVTLEAVLAHMFCAELGSEESWSFSAPYIELQENARSAKIEHKGGFVIFKDDFRTEGQKNDDASELFGIRRSRGVASFELMNLYVPLYVEMRDGMSWAEAPTRMQALNALMAPLVIKPSKGSE